jgi:chromosome segregation ATPase
LLDNKERYTERTIAYLTFIITDTNDETRKLKKELDVNRLEYEEILQTLSDMKNQLSNERQNAELAYRREKDTKERNDKLATELEKCQIRLQNIEGQHSRSTEILKNDYQMRITKLEQIIEK